MHPTNVSVKLQLKSAIPGFSWIRSLTYLLKITELWLSSIIWYLLVYCINNWTSGPKFLIPELTIFEKWKLCKFFSLKLILLTQSKSVGVISIWVHLMWSSTQLRKLWFNQPIIQKPLMRYNNIWSSPRMTWRNLQWCSAPWILRTSLWKVFSRLTNTPEPKNTSKRKSDRMHSLTGLKFFMYTLIQLC